MTDKLQQLKSRALANKDVKKAYEELGPEFELIDTLLRMRKSAGLTQDQLAQRMGTKEANISRLEKGRGNPTLKTLVKYAEACGCVLHFSFEPA